MTRPAPLAATTFALLLAPLAALAHPGHDLAATAPMQAGLAHPLGGADHLLAMLAIGLLAASRGRRIVWGIPAAFLTAMVAGGALGAAGLPLPGVEPMILASVIVLGALVALAVRLPVGGLVLLAAAFGLAHGHAHGTEAHGAALLPYAAGFVLATGALHAAGIALGRFAGRGARWAGAATAACGLAMVFAG